MKDTSKNIKRNYTEKQAAAKLSRKMNIPDYREIREGLAEKDKVRFALLTERKKAVDEDIHVRQEITKLK